MKLVMFGTGQIAGQLMERIETWSDKLNIDIVCFVDNDESKNGSIFYGRFVYLPFKLEDMQYDYICILLGKAYEEVYDQLVFDYHIEENKIVNRHFILKQIMLRKYKDSEDSDIKDTISYWKNRNLTFFNQFQFAPVKYEKVLWDNINQMPYVLYQNRRIYYPREYKDFIVKDGVKYAISYREMEQHKLSPHRYLTDEIFIQENDIVVDAGAREGDFALPYIDILKKLYLFEGDAGWVEALRMTYRDYSNKVIIISKMLSDTVDEKVTTLQESIKEAKVDVLKMDIEGSEVKALSSSPEFLKNNNLRCSICCYHRKNDREDIEKILAKAGYQCSESKGYVVFTEDPYILEEADFRKAMVYAFKRK